MLSQTGSLFPPEYHLTGLHYIKVGKIENMRIGQFHRVRGFPKRVDSRQSLDAPDKLAIGCRIIRHPPASKPVLAARQVRTLEAMQRLVSSATGSAAAIRRADAGVDHPRVVILRFCSWKRDICACA